MDLDVYKTGAWSREDAEREKGPLPDTPTIATGRGGLQMWYQHPEGAELPGSPENTIGPAFCVKSGGGYVVAPPSATADRYRTVLKMEPSELPAWLVEELRGRRTPAHSSPRSREARSQVEGGPIPENSRNTTVFFLALGHKDRGGKHGEVLAEALAINEKRCSPPMDAGEVEKIVASAMRYPVRSGKPSPELDEALKRLEAHWWESRWPGTGGKTDRDVYRALLDLASRYGMVRGDGAVEVPAAVRTVALLAATTFETVSRGATPRLWKSGRIEKRDNGRSAKEAATWVLLPVSPTVNTGHLSAPIDKKMPCVDDQLRSRLGTLSTPAFRWTGHVKKGRAGVLYVLEACGPMSLPDLAGQMGWGNARELKRRYLEDREREDGTVVQGLVSMGLVEDRGGVYGLHGDHAERVEEVRRAPYTTVSRRRRKGKDGARTVYSVDERENTASELEREEQQRKDHREQQEGFRRYLESVETSDSVRFEELPKATPDQLRDARRRFEERRLRRALRGASGFVSELEPAGGDDRIRSVHEVFGMAKDFFGKEAAA